MSRNNTNNNNPDDGRWDWLKIGGALAGIAVGVGIAAAVASSQNNDDQNDPQRRRYASSSSSSSSNSSGVIRFESRGVGEPPEKPHIVNLDTLLSDIHVRYVALRKEDFELHYKVFDRIFDSLHKKMKKVDKYYERYSGMKQFAGSHYDGLRIKKPDEFDMDVAIGLPLNISEDKNNRNNSDIVIEPIDAGYVELKMGKQFINLINRDDFEINKTCYNWKDDDGYLLRSKCIDWFKSVVVRALNEFDQYCGRPVFYVDSLPYTINLSQSGPAITLKITTSYKWQFKMDVDLVPVLRFPESRWPITPEYRRIPPSSQKTLPKFWYVVPKPNKNSDLYCPTRSWRIALHYQERGWLYNSNNLRVAIKLLKKLRDSMEMHKIASYYIKTLAYWEIVRRGDASFGATSVANIFKMLVDCFYTALENRKIPYIWNENLNLLEGIKDSTLSIYAVHIRKLKVVLNDSSEYKKVAKFLLTPSEYNEYSSKYL